MLKRISPLLAMAASFFLSGCFFSETPKFPMTSAVAAFGEGGRYQSYEREDGDNYKKDEVMVLKHRADGAYDFVDEKGEVQPISFHPLPNGYVIGQAKEKDKPRYGYVLMRIAGNEAFLYVPDCQKQDKAALEKIGVVFVGEYECTIDRVTDPAAFFASLKIGDPLSKLVRE